MVKHYMWVEPAGNYSVQQMQGSPGPTWGTRRVDWGRERDRIVDDLRRRTSSLGYPTDVVVEKVYDPTDWERMGMERGTPFALAHTFLQTGPFRPNTVNRKIPGLDFTGSSTLPGVGVPMVLVSGKLAAERVDEYAASRRT